MRIRLHPVVVDTQWSLTVLGKYFDEMSGQLQDITNINYFGILQKLKHDPNLDETDRQEFFQIHYQYYEHEFPSRLRYSFIILLYMILETQLRATCDSLKKEKDIELGLSDITGNDEIDRARKYIERVAGIKGLDTAKWSEPRTLQKVRNCLVHANGEIKQFKRDGDRKHIEQYAGQRKGLTIDSWGFLSPAPAYCRNALSAVRELFRSIFEACGWEPDKQGQIINE